MSTLAVDREGSLRDSTTMNPKKLKKNKKKAAPDSAAVTLRKHGDISYRQGNYTKAIHFYEQAFAIHPADYELCNFLGVLHKLAGNCDKEKEYYKKALQINPFHAGANYNLGTCCRREGNRTEAIRYLRRSVAADPQNSVCLNNLANLLVEEKKFDEALALYDLLLGKDARSFNALLNKGFLFLEQGDLHRAIRFYERALSVEPNNPKAAIYYAEAMFIEEGAEKNLARLNTLLAGTTLDNEHRIDVTVSKALCAWITGDIPAYEQSLHFLRDKIFTTIFVANADYMKHRQAYYVFLEALQPFAGEIASPAEGPHPEILHIVGDSHCLSPANRLVRFHDRRYLCRSHLIMGVKAWHLAQNGPNKFKLAFEKNLAALRPGSHVVFMIGEIDCRCDEGIFHHCRGKNADAQEIMRATADGYLDFVVTRAQQKEIVPIIAGVPAPDKVKFAKLAAEDKRSYLETVRDYNLYLSGKTKEKGILFLDVFRHTANSELSANGRYHLDKLHLRPDFLEVALQACDG